MAFPPNIQTGISIISLILLVFTAYLSFQTHVFQVRTQIRESLEEFEDVEIKYGDKLTALLHKFEYFDKYRIWRSKTMILIQHRHTREVPASASALHYDIMYWLPEENKEEFLDTLTNIKNVSDAQYSEHGIIITVTTGNAVKVRRISQKVIQIINMSERNWT